jgi:hypothetical protein
MRKRRVGVTAKSRQNEGNQATGTLQFVTEMAAPLELRTPAGTCGKSCKSSADGSMATRARNITSRMKSESEGGTARARPACHPLHRHPVATRPPVKATLTARWGSALTGPGRVAGKTLLGGGDGRHCSSSSLPDPPPAGRRRGEFYRARKTTRK